MEAGTTPNDDASTLYNKLTSIFQKIVSPFSAYQQSLPKLEADYLGSKTQLIAKDVSSSVTAVSASNLNTLQNAIDRLVELSDAAFPLAEGALSRFEVLRGGYGPTNALSRVDSVLAEHASELALAVNTLSAAMMADEQLLASNFDEPQVLCTLEVLKVAGTFRRGLSSMDQKTRERLVLLSERMESHASREKALELAATTSSTFTLPDSLSAVEIDSFLTKIACGSSPDENLSSSASVIKQLETQGAALFAKADEATRTLAASCQTFVLNVCSSVPRVQLAEMANMTSWQERDTNDAFSYGAVPQSYITQVGEHILALVQAFDPFTSDHVGLNLANEVMSDLRDIALAPWRDFVSATGAVGSDALARDLMEGKKLAGFTLTSSDTPVVEDCDPEDEERDEAEAARAAFCDAWLDVVGLSITGRLLQRVMMIPSLSSKGCEHVSADLKYLFNVLAALCIAGHPHPLIGHIAEVSVLDTAVLTQQAASRDRNDRIGDFLAVLEERLVRLRS